MRSGRNKSRLNFNNERAMTYIRGVVRLGNWHFLATHGLGNCVDMYNSLEMLKKYTKYLPGFNNYYICPNPEHRRGLKSSPGSERT